MNNEMNVKVKSFPVFGDPTPVLTTIFATLCYCFWANTMGFFTDGAVLAIGVLQLAVFASYTIGGVILLRNGNSFGGNTFMIFATVFGGIGGATHVVMTMVGERGIAFCYQICGVAFIVAGVYLLCMLPPLRYAAKTDFLAFLTGGIGVLAYGLTGAGLAPAALNYVGAWALLIDGLVGFYSVISAMIGFAGGKPLPLGKPFFKKPEEKTESAEIVQAALIEEA